MNSHSSKKPGDAHKKRTTSMRPQLEQLDPRLCFSIDLPDVLPELSTTEVPAEISTYVEITTEWNTANENTEEETKDDEKDLDGTLEDDPFDTPEDELDFGPEDPNQTLSTNDSPVTSAVAPSDANGFYSNTASESTREAGFVFDTSQEPLLQVFPELNTQTGSPSSAPTFPAAPAIAITNSVAAPSSPLSNALPLVQPVTILPLPAPSMANATTIRRDISALVGNQIESPSNSVELATPSIGDIENRQSSVDVAVIATPPVVAEVATLPFDTSTVEETSFPKQWVVQPTELGLMQKAIFQRGISSMDFDGLSGIQIEEVIGTDADLVSLLAQASVSSNLPRPSTSENLPPEDQETKLSENTYRLLIAGLIALPTSTRGKEILRWIRRDKKKTTEP